MRQKLRDCLNPSKLNKGSFTVELTIVLTVVLFILFSFVFGIMVLYQQVFLQKAVNTAILNVADKPGFSGNTGDYTVQIETEFNKEMDKSIFGHDAEPDVVFTPATRDRLIKADDVYCVTATQKISLPLNFMKDFLSDTGYIKIKATSYFITDNTIDNIRNVDLLIEIVDRLKDKF